MNAQQPVIVISDKTGWHKIGETRVDYKTDKDEIMIMGADRFSTLVIKVTKAPVEIILIEIYFEDGTTQKAAIEQSFKSPGQTDVIQLAGGERELKKVVFLYKTITNPEDKNGHVEIWGMKKDPNKKSNK